MKIKDLKINGFGKLKDKEINFQDGINIIYGENEAGKSTLLKYITAMFYGLSKNKNGGTIPEIEKYEPWNNEEFSGKISYELDNNETYEVYREFKKKNPKIFNKNLEDISKEFNVDKTKGIEFFKDQVGIEEDIFTSSVITKQAEVKLDEKEQNTLIQKISNILGTGEDTTSYTTIVNKLKKKLNDEVGTSNTKERPINIIENRIHELISQKEELEKYSSYKFDIDERISRINEEIEKLNKDIDRLREANIEKDKLKENENRININKEVLNRIQDEIDNLNNEKKEYKVENKAKLSKVNLISIILLLILSVISLIFKSNTYIKILLPVVLGIYCIYLITKVYLKNKDNNKVKEKQKEIIERIKILEENKERQLIELGKIEEEYNKELVEIKNKSGIVDLNNLLELISDKQKSINEASIKLHTLKIDNDNAIPKLEKLVNIEEELESLKEDRVNLERKRDNIKRTLEYLEIAYNKMKEQITPKFTEELSKVMDRISEGKYKNVRINTNGEIVVEQKNGEYIKAENLSIGTIDQLYLSLRLATIKEITKENMPIILDEAFAYYDDTRLQNILNYLANEYNNKQVIIFTCTDREKQILEKLQIKYNLIHL